MIKKAIRFWYVTGNEVRDRCKECFRDPWLSVMLEMVCCALCGIARCREGNQLSLKCIAPQHHPKPPAMFPYYTERHITQSGKGKQRADDQNYI